MTASPRKIDGTLLAKISKHSRNLGLKQFIKGLHYERCAELPRIVALLQERFSEKLKYLDIGSGESPLPTFLLKHTKWDISCLDKFSWVQSQRNFKDRTTKDKNSNERFHIIQEDLLATRGVLETYDIITNVSVIEHFEGMQDAAAMRASAQLLKPGGLYILTTLINEGFFKEFFVRKSVYGERFQSKPVYYQRHYDLKSLQERIISPTGLLERERVYFGDYDFQCFEKVFQNIPRPLRAFYQWATPYFARHFLSYRSYPVSRQDMNIDTASGVILVLEHKKSASQLH